MNGKIKNAGTISLIAVLTVMVFTAGGTFFLSQSTAADAKVTADKNALAIVELKIEQAVVIEKITRISEDIKAIDRKLDTLIRLMDNLQLVDPNDRQ